MSVLDTEAVYRSLVHPADWQNPVPQARYNLVVIGGGTAGLVSAAGAAGLGARVALIERDRLGGDCLNVGCVPSKALLRCARAIAEVRGAERFGVHIGGPIDVDFSAIMQRMRSLRTEMASNDSAQRFRSLGVDVYLGQAQFTGPTSVEVAGVELQFSRAIIATGARAAVPPIPGLAESTYRTNEDIFDLTLLPRRLAVLGGGPIGCELAQAFARFGSQVTLITQSKTLLPREHLEASALVAKSLHADGVQLLLGTEVQSVASSEQGHRLAMRGQAALETDLLLIAVGRQANVDKLGLENASVRYTAAGVEVDDHLRTNNPRIFAAGDICSRFQFTHAADAMARIAIQNALFFGRARMSALTIPWCTYTEPELARVGLSREEAEKKGISVQSVRVEMSRVDRAVLDGDAEGFLEVLVRKGTERIVGATAVGSQASTLIAEITLAMTAGLGLKTLARTIHAYPTQMEAARKIGDAYNRSRLTPWIKSAFTKFLSWRR